MGDVNGHGVHEKAAFKKNALQVCTSCNSFSHSIHALL